MTSPTRENQVEVLSRLRAAVERELQSVKPGDHITRVAWTCRNILELLVWVEHCAKSQENAHQFALDCLRDAREIIDKLPKTLMRDAAFDAKAEAQKFVATAKASGVGDIEDGFKAVRDAAKGLGKEVEFGYLNKLLSKFAHPTAPVVLTSYQKDAEAALEQYKKQFLDAIKTYGDEALRLISDSMRG